MKKIVKGILIVGILFLVCGIILGVKDKVYVYVDQYLSPYKYVTLGDVNEYYRDQDFQFVQNTQTFIPQNRQDLINIYYTIINAGKNTFTFYCTDDYPSCIQDVQDIANDQAMLSDINNYVHPYNGFSHIETEYDSLGMITINIVHNYTPEEIEKINERVDLLAKDLIREGDTPYNNILRVHDYIVNHTRYDTARSNDGDTTYDSDIAYGPLFQGMGICGGYTDLMQLFLEKMGIPSFRVSSEKHVWNAVFYNNRWVNLDLTWDDPVNSDGSHTLEHNFFLIDTNKLLQIEQNEHIFDREHYPELN